MKIRLIYKFMILAFLLPLSWSCKIPLKTIKTENKMVPASFMNSKDTSNLANLTWREYFSDETLKALIDTALKNNQELNIVLQEIEISKNEVMARKGEYLPFVRLKAGNGLEKEGRFTRHGAVDEQLEIKPGKAFPNPLTDNLLGAYATWEVDVWKKLRNAKKSAVSRFLGSIEGKNFMVTNLVAEIADSYYELMALDNSLAIIEQNIIIQSNALKVVKLQKESAKVTQLAVNRFEAQLLNTKNLQYAIKQKMVETENRLNFLTGRFSQPIPRNSADFNQKKMDTLQAGIPSQLLANRPDVRQAEYELAAAKLDVQVARANFFPSFGIKAGIGFQAFNPTLLFNPESILYNLAGDMMAPLVNRNAIKALYNTASAKQIQAVYKYEQTILSAYVDVMNQLSKINNYKQSYNTKAQEVELLIQSIQIANSLFNSARADYGEVLFTQREALEAKMDLIEIQLKQLNAQVNIYRALGGGGK